MIRYAIKHIPTGYYIPEPEGRAGRGGSHTEPHPNSNDARLFKTERSAKLFLGSWLKGKYVADRGYSAGHPGNDWEQDYWEEIHIVPQPNRKREDMEIIKLEILLP
jgi:hypothetical protein